MREAVLLDRVLERARDVRLPDEIVERLRTIFSRENLIAHAPNLIRANRPRKQKSENVTGLTGFRLVEPSRCRNSRFFH